MSRSKGALQATNTQGVGVVVSQEKISIPLDSFVPALKKVLSRRDKSQFLKRDGVLQDEMIVDFLEELIVYVSKFNRTQALSLFTASQYKTAIPLCNWFSIFANPVSATFKCYQNTQTPQMIHNTCVKLGKACCNDPQQQQYWFGCVIAYYMYLLYQDKETIIQTGDILDMATAYDNREDKPYKMNVCQLFFNIKRLQQYEKLFKSSISSNELLGGGLEQVHLSSETPTVRKQADITNELERIKKTAVREQKLIASQELQLNKNKDKLEKDMRRIRELEMEKEKYEEDANLNRLVRREVDRLVASKPELADVPIAGVAKYFIRNGDIDNLLHAFMQDPGYFDIYADEVDHGDSDNDETEDEDEDGRVSGDKEQHDKEQDGEEDDEQEKGGAKKDVDDDEAGQVSDDKEQDDKEQDDKEQDGEQDDEQEKQSDKEDDDDNEQKEQVGRVSKKTGKPLNPRKRKSKGKADQDRSYTAKVLKDDIESDVRRSNRTRRAVDYLGSGQRQSTAHYDYIRSGSRKSASARKGRNIAEKDANQEGESGNVKDSEDVRDTAHDSAQPNPGEIEEDPVQDDEPMNLSLSPQKKMA